MLVFWACSHALALVAVSAAWRWFRRAAERERVRAVRAEYLGHLAEARALRAEEELARAAHDLRNAMYVAKSSLALWSEARSDSLAGVRAAVDRATAVAHSISPARMLSVDTNAGPSDAIVERVIRRSVEAHRSRTGFEVSISGALSIAPATEANFSRVMDNLVANAAREAAGVGNVWIVVSPDGVLVQNPTADPERACTCLRARRSGYGSTGLGLGIAIDQASKIGMRIDWDVDPVARVVTARVSRLRPRASAGAEQAN